MTTEGYTLKHVPARYGRDTGDPSVAGPLHRAVTASAIRRTNLQQSSLKTSRRAAKKRLRSQFEAGRMKFTPKTQPRDTVGKFRKVLARLKLNLGDQATEQLAKEMEEVEAAGSIGNYEKAREAGANVIKLLDSVDSGSLSEGDINNIRKGSSELGKLLAYLPLPQGDRSAKVRFSDLPTPVGDLIRDLIERVKTKLSSEDSVKYIAILESFISGGRLMSSDEMSAELAKILRVLA